MTISHFLKEQVRISLHKEYAPHYKHTHTHTHTHTQTHTPRVGGLKLVRVSVRNREKVRLKERTESVLVNCLHISGLCKLYCLVNHRRACAARVTLCVSVCVCVCLSVTALAATAFVSACNQRHLRHYFRLFFVDFRKNLHLHACANFHPLMRFILQCRISYYSPLSLATVYTHHTHPVQGPGTMGVHCALGNRMHSVPRACI